MNVFKELALRVHPDINGNTPINNSRMVEINLYRSNQNILVALARKWGFELKSIPIDYTKFAKTEYRPNWFFKVYPGYIYELKYNEYNEFINMIIQSRYDVRTMAHDENRFRFLGILPKWEYSDDNISILIKNSKYFKSAKLVRTSAKCAFVKGEHGVQQFNIDSVIGRRVHKESEKWY